MLRLSILCVLYASVVQGNAENLNKVTPAGYLMINEKKYISTERTNALFIEGAVMNFSCHKTNGVSVQLAYTTSDGKPMSTTTESIVQVKFNKSVHNRNTVKCIILSSSGKDNITIAVQLLAKKEEEIIKPTGYLIVNNANYTEDTTYRYTEGDILNLTCHRSIGDLVKLSVSKKPALDDKLDKAEFKEVMEINEVVNTTGYNEINVECVISDRLDTNRNVIKLHFEKDFSKTNDITPTGYLSVNDKNFTSAGVHHYTLKEEENVTLVCQNTTLASTELILPSKANSSRFVNGVNGRITVSILTSIDYNNTEVECSLNNSTHTVQIKAVLTVIRKEKVNPQEPGTSSTTNQPPQDQDQKGGSSSSEIVKVTESSQTTAASSATHFTLDHFTIAIIIATLLVFTAIL